MSASGNPVDFAAATDLTLRLQAVWGFDATTDSPVALHEPLFSERETRYVQDTIASGFVSSVGVYVDLFGQKLSEFTGVSHAIPIVNGTSALQLALHLSGVRAGDEVAIPSLSFIATANAVRFLGAEPVFLDSCSVDSNLTLGISSESFLELITNYQMSEGSLRNKKSGARLSALVPMHTLGRLVDMTNLETLAGELGVAVVEDAAEALGSFRGRLHSGSRNIATLSFNGNKTITTGGGGAILTNDPEIASLARSLSSTAKVDHPWRFSHTAVGWNFRLPAINSALGCAQMDALETILQSKSSLANKYSHSFLDSEFFDFLPNPTEQKPNNWLSAVRVKNKNVNLDTVLNLVNAKGIRCRPMWDLLSDQAPYQFNQKTRLVNAVEIRNSIITIPSSPKLDYGA
jgi:perosamine synthetase